MASPGILSPSRPATQLGPRAGIKAGVCFKTLGLETQPPSQSKLVPDLPQPSCLQAGSRPAAALQRAGCSQAARRTQPQSAPQRRQRESRAPRASPRRERKASGATGAPATGRVLRSELRPAGRRAGRRARRGAAAEGAAPAERGGDAGAGWRGLGAGRAGLGRRRSRRRALELRARGEESRAAGVELEEAAAAARLVGESGWETASSD